MVIASGHGPVPVPVVDGHLWTAGCHDDLDLEGPGCVVGLEEVA